MSDQPIPSSLAVATIGAGPVVADIAGEAKAAREAHPAPTGAGVSGASSWPTESDSCCGGPAPAGADACCALDVDAKAEGEDGCGCSDKAESRPQEEAACCRTTA